MVFFITYVFVCVHVHCVLLLRASVLGQRACCCGLVEFGALLFGEMRTKAHLWYSQLIHHVNTWTPSHCLLFFALLRIHSPAGLYAHTLLAAPWIIIYMIFIALCILQLHFSLYYITLHYICTTLYFHYIIYITALILFTVFIYVVYFTLFWLITWCTLPLHCVALHYIALRYSTFTFY